MGIFDKIISKSAGEMVGQIGNVVDKIATSQDEKLNAKNKLSKIVTDKLTELASFQRDVLIAEMKGTWLQRSWRPIVMLAFAAIVVYSKFIAPAFSLPNAELETDFWGLLEIGLGGYVIGRTVEKVTDRVTQNVDLTFLKKKDRKNHFKDGK